MQSKSTFNAFSWCALSWQVRLVRLFLVLLVIQHASCARRGELIKVEYEYDSRAERNELTLVTIQSPDRDDPSLILAMDILPCYSTREKNIYERKTFDWGDDACGPPMLICGGGAVLGIFGLVANEWLEEQIDRDDELKDSQSVIIGASIALTVIGALGSVAFIGADDCRTVDGTFTQTVPVESSPGEAYQLMGSGIKYRVSNSYNALTKTGTTDEFGRILIDLIGDLDMNSIPVRHSDIRLNVSLEIDSAGKPVFGEMKLDASRWLDSCVLVGTAGAQIYDSYRSGSHKLIRTVAGGEYIEVTDQEANGYIKLRNEDGWVLGDQVERVLYNRKFR